MQKLTSRLRIGIVLFLVLGWSNHASAVAILSEDFDAGIPGTWSVVDNEGTGIDWRTNTAWGEGNYTNGSGLAATICSDCFAGAYDAELRSSGFDLTGSTVATLTYSVNYQNFAGLDFLNVDISIDGGTGWTSLLSWNEDHGGFRSTPGEDVSIDLAAYTGLSNLMLRWHAFNPNSGVDFDWYAQIDDVLVDANQVPEPAPLGLLLLGVAAVALGRKKRLA